MSLVLVEKVFSLRTSKDSSRLGKEVLLVVGGSLLMALLAQISLPLPFTPVPITAQSLGVLVIGASFGSKRAATVMVLYLLEGAMGLPFFAGASFGLAKMMGPSGGYLIGFVLAAYLMGLASEKSQDRHILNSLLLFSIGHAVIFACGLIWLSTLVGSDHVLSVGLYPFIPGLVIKTGLASLMLPTAWKMAGDK